MLTKEATLAPAFIIVAFAVMLAISSDMKLPPRAWLPMLWGRRGRIVWVAPRTVALWCWPAVDFVALTSIWLSELSSSAALAATVVLGMVLMMLQSAHVLLIRRESSF